MTYRSLAKLYNIHITTLFRYLHNHRTKVNKMATIYIYKGKLVKRSKLNKKQISYIIKNVMQDPPESYKLVRGSLIKINDND